MPEYTCLKRDGEKQGKNEEQKSGTVGKTTSFWHIPARRLKIALEA